MVQLGILMVKILCNSNCHKKYYQWHYTVHSYSFSSQKRL